MYYGRYHSILYYVLLGNVFFSVLSELRREELPRVARGCRQNMAGINGGPGVAKCSARFCRSSTSISCLVMHACL